MQVIKFSVPEVMLADAAALAQADGLPLAEFHRSVWILGLDAKAERSNKRLINRRLRRNEKLD